MRNNNQSLPIFRPRLGGWIAALLVLEPWGVRAEVYTLPSGSDDVIGQVEYATARQEDTLIDIARRTSVGQVEMNMANPKVDRWLPGAGTRVVIPHRYILPDSPRAGIVVNIPEMRLYFFPVQYSTITHKKAVPGKAKAAHGKDGKPAKGKSAPPPVTYVTTTEMGEPVAPASQVITYPVSMGRMDWRTPIGKTRIAQKVKDPTWTPPESIKREHAKKGEILPDVVPAGPENPLGPYAMKLGVPGYLIHGTDRADPAKPFGIGERVTHGCMRMYNEDVTKLFPEVSVGTPVYLVNQPIKLGWSAGELYMEVTWPLDEDIKEIPAKWGDDVLDESNLSEEEIKAIRAKKRTLMVAYLTKLGNTLIEKENAKHAILVDRAAIKAAVEHPSGIPVAIGKLAEPPVIETAPSEYPANPYGSPHPAPQAVPAYPYGGTGQSPAPNAGVPYGQPVPAAPSAPRQYPSQPQAAYPYGTTPYEAAPSRPQAEYPYGGTAQPAPAEQPQYGRPPATYPYGSQPQPRPVQYPSYPAGQSDPYARPSATQPYTPERAAPSSSTMPDPFAPAEEEEEEQ